MILKSWARLGPVLICAISQAGREASPEWNAAMELASRLDWYGVWETLQEAP